MRVTSAAVTLKPGIEVEEKKIDTATVRLLTNSERSILNQIADLEEQNKRYFIEQINSFGTETDRQKIEQYALLLTWPDEERLHHAMDDLLNSFRDPKFCGAAKHTCPGCGREIECERAATATSQS